MASSNNKLCPKHALSESHQELHAGTSRARKHGADSESNEGELQDFELISLEGVGVICIEFPELILGGKRTYTYSLTPIILKPGLCTVNSPHEPQSPSSSYSAHLPGKRLFAEKLLAQVAYSFSTSRIVRPRLLATLRTIF